jgi:hypothetical protein
MKTNEQMEKQASRIADAIVDLVERNNGPVTLAQIEREILGFAKETPPAWSKMINHNGRELLIWDGMTEAGAAALGKVIFGGRVAIQADLRPYLLEGCLIKNENWWPIGLLPAGKANLRAPNNLLMRVSPKFVDYCVRRADAECLPGYQLLTPSVHYTADRFSVL